MSEETSEHKDSCIEIEHMADKKIVANENTEKLKVLMRQLSDSQPKMNGSSNSLAKRYTKIAIVVALYW